MNNIIVLLVAISVFSILGYNATFHTAKISPKRFLFHKLEESTRSYHHWEIMFNFIWKKISGVVMMIIALVLFILMIDLVIGMVAS